MHNRIQPLVSIVIPNYNNGRFLEKCIQSCLVQTYENLEIIIVDDNSNDNSVEIIKKLQIIDNRIKLIKNNMNYGVSRTRHIGVMNARGDWITTLDSDDFLFSSQKIEKEMEIISKYNFRKNVIAFSGIVFVNENGKLIGRDKRKIKEGNIFKEILTRNCFIPRDFTFNKALYKEVGGFDFRIPLYEDWDFKIRVSKIGLFYFSGLLNGIAYRQHDKGLSSVDKKMHLKWMNYVFEKNSNCLTLEQKKIYKKELFPNLLTRIIRKIKVIK